MRTSPIRRSPLAGTRRTRNAAFGLVSIALLFASGAQARYDTERFESNLELVFTTSEDRSTATRLDGAGTTAEGSIAIFLRSMLSLRETYYGIRNVRFSINGRVINVERYAPYDLAGTRNGANAYLVDKSILHAGENTIQARVKLRDGRKFTLSGVLTVLPESPSIVEIATGNDDFSLLVEALIAADLVDAVNGPGPITVFAPTNEAFVTLLGELGLSKEALFANTELLTTVLTYHVVPGALFSPAVLASETLTPLQGEPITVDPSGPAVNDSLLGPIDLAASNGIVHVIDRVLLPGSIANPQSTIAELASADGRFGTLLLAATEVGLDGLLSVNGPNVTLFAPTDDAFAALLAALDISASELLDNKPLLTTVLLYHLVNEELFAADVLASEEIFPMESEPIAVDAGAGLLNDAGIVETDLDASNGVVHVIDAVLVPPAAVEILTAE